MNRSYGRVRAPSWTVPARGAGPIKSQLDDPATAYLWKITNTVCLIMAGVALAIAALVWAADLAAGHIA